MYVSGNESAAEKYCKENQIAVEPVRSWGDCRHVIGKSRYRVEYAFNNLTKYDRENLLEGAELDISDLVSSTFSGEKLHHFTLNGRRKIGRAFRFKVRELSKKFPEGITEREFTLIDKALN
ncbi:hypothetical protein HMPREF1119_1008 [Haemophilus parainfluenzae HK2019]|jgi:raw score 8.45|uniref:Uncharacterized protein n=1 Tax=Haemophilus parainfluenzae HK2019 TaxID=1095746 RepID=A0ABP2NVE1_HAEPA|nr:hypothetical protein [Haemophilus parainfluenzae]EIJ28560.1 hypothetical protein HMPREF1119_1008 [Haemophilus parainfluenzae HK2019]OBX75015.1 hypothetical protein A9298_09665 [Haemophilus parainfluenzae]